MNAQVHEFPQREDVRTPPASVEHEQNVLGAILLNPSSLSKVDLEPSDFFLRQHQELFRLLVAMDAEGKPIDALTVGERAESTGLDKEIGGSGYICELASVTWTVGNVRSYAETVREKAAMRRVIEVASVLMQEAFQPRGRKAGEIVDAAVGELMALAKVDRNCDFSLGQAVKLAWADAQEAYEHRGTIRGVPTGFARMDARLGGWHREDLIFLPARPGQGKTALAVNGMLAAAAAGYTVGLVSGEQSAMQIGQRSIAIEGRVPAEIMRNGRIDDDVWPVLNGAAARLAKQRIRIFDRGAPTYDEVVRVARRWKQEYRLSVLFVDYLQRIRVRGCEKRNEEVAEVAVGLKTLARDLGIPVVCLAQVKADVETRNDKRPRQGDIANSDEATREADVIAFLYRDEVYHDDTEDRGIAEINVEKNRHGPTGQFRVGFDAPSLRFFDLNDAEAQHRMEYSAQPSAPRRARKVPTEPLRGSRKTKAERQAAADEAADARIRDVTGGN